MQTRWLVGVFAGLLSNDVDLMAVHQRVRPGWFFRCRPATRCENMLVAHLEIIEEEGNVVENQ